MQENTHKETVAAQTEGQRAGEAAARANERAVKLEAEAENAKARIAIAQKEAAEATARAAEANARAQNLRQQHLPRWPRDKAEMINILKKSTGTVEIFYFFGDWDSTLLSKMLRQVLLDSGWKVALVKPLSAEKLSNGRNTIGW